MDLKINSVFRKIKYLVFLVVISTLTIEYWLGHKNLLGGGESGLPFYNPILILSGIQHAWTEAGLGNSNGIYTSGIFFWKVISFLYNRGLSNIALENFFFLFLWGIAGVSVFLLIKEFFPEIEDRFAFLGTAFYWFNPISLVNVWNRFLYNYMVFWAYLPLALLLFIKGVKNKDFKFAILTSLSSVVFSFALTSIPFNLILWFLFFYTVIFFSFLKKDILFYLKYFLLTLVSFVLFNFWWISQVFSYAGSSVAGKAVSEFFTTEGNIANLTTLSLLLGKFSDILRFQHGTFFSRPAISWAKVYDLPLISVFGFFFVFLVLWVILKFKKRLEVLFLVILFLISLFLVKGNNPPLGEIFEFFFTKFTILQVFRNPFEKFGFLLMLSATPLFTLGVSGFSKAIKKEKLRRFFVGFTFFYIFVFLGFPFWTGFIFTRQDPVTKELETYEVKVPDYYKKVNEWFKKQGNDFRFVSLPIGGEGMTYTWEKPYSGVELSSTFFETPNISFNTSIPYYNDIVSELSKYQLSDKIFDFFPYLNVRYLLVRSDIDYKERKVANPETILEKAKEWEEKGLIKKELEEGKLTVYKVDDRFFLPKVYLAQEVILSNSRNFSSFFRPNLDFTNNRIVLLGQEYIDKTPSFNRLEVEPKFINSVNQAFRDFKSLGDEDILARLFYVRHLPNSQIYPLIRFKEGLEIMTQNGSDGKFNYKANLLGKRAVEVYRSYKTGEKQLVVLSEKNYRNYLKSLLNDLSILKERKGDRFQISDYVRDLLYLQEELLERVNSPLVGDLRNLVKFARLESNFDLSLPRYNIYSIYIPQEGLYQISGDRNLGSAGIYLDGEKVNEENLLDLDKGEHELVVGIEDGEKVIEEKDVLPINNDFLPTWSFKLPDEPSSFDVSFKWIFRGGDSFIVEIYEDIDDRENPILRKEIVKPLKFHDYQEVGFNFSTIPGTKEIRIAFVPKKEKECVGFLFRECREVEEKLEAEVKDFRISRTSGVDLSFIQSGKKELKYAGGSSVNHFERVNPTKYYVSIQKEDSTSDFLVFSELFSTEWEAYYDDGEKIPEDKHFLANGYANAWIIDKLGTHEITIKYKPQEILEIGEKVSFVSIIAAILLVSVSTLFRKRYAKKA